MDKMIHINGKYIKNITNLNLEGICDKYDKLDIMISVSNINYIIYNDECNIMYIDYANKKCNIEFIDNKIYNKLKKEIIQNISKESLNMELPDIPLNS